VEIKDYSFALSVIKLSLSTAHVLDVLQFEMVIANGSLKLGVLWRRDD
jgi:hypothetical protein